MEIPEYLSRIFATLVFQQDYFLYIFTFHGGREHVKWGENFHKQNFPSFIDKDRWPPHSPDINPLDYCIWDEFVKAIDWSRVTSKQTLIQELKRGVKNIRHEVVVESCVSWTNRLYRLSQNDGNYLRK